MRVILPLKVVVELVRSKDVLDELKDDPSLRKAYINKIDRVLTQYGLSAEHFEAICEHARKGKIV